MMLGFIINFMVMKQKSELFFGPTNHKEINEDIKPT